MSDLISREALIESLNPEYLDTRKLIEQGETHLDNLAEGYTEVYKLIKTAPQVDAVEVVHGHWITKTTSAGAPYTICSHCNTSVKYNDEYGTVVMNLKGANYCPNCGAKMNEVSK